MNLSPEEKAEYEKLKQLEAAEKQKTVESDSGKRLESALTGGLQGLSGGFADEVNAVVEAAPEAFMGAAINIHQKGLQGIPDSITQAKEIWKKKHQDEEANMAELANKHPGYYYGSDIAGSIASTLLGVGALRAAKGGAAALKTASGYYSSLGAIGAAHGVGRTKEDTIEDRIKGGVEGALLSVSGEAVAPGLAKAGLGAAKWGIDKSKRMAQKVQSTHLIDFLGDTFSNTKRKLSQVGKDVIDWSDRMVNYADDEGTPLIKMTSSLNDLDGVFFKQRDIAGKKMGALLGAIDSGEKGVKLHMDPEALYHKLARNHAEPLEEALHSVDQKLGAKLRKELKETFLSNLEINTGDVDKMGNPLTKNKIVNKNLTLVKLHKMASQIHSEHRGLTERATTSSGIRLQKARKSMAKDLSESIDDMVEMSGGAIDQDLLGQYRGARQKYGDLVEAHDIVYNELSRDHGADFLTKLFKDRVFTYTSGMATLAKGLNIPYVPEIAAAIAGIRALSHTNVVNKSFALGLQPIIKAMSMNPQKYTPLATKLIHSSTLGGPAFIDQLHFAAAEINLSENPLARTSNEVIRRKDDVLTRIGAASPDVAKQLRKAIEDNDVPTIRSIMAVASEKSNSGTIEEGMGWDGYAITPADQQRVNGWISSIQDVRKKRDLSKQFTADGKIPDDMLQGSDGQSPPKRFVYEKARNKVRNPEY